jgi:hypothetical protein
VLAGEETELLVGLQNEGNSCCFFHEIFPVATSVT